MILTLRKMDEIFSDPVKPTVVTSPPKRDMYAQRTGKSAAFARRCAESVQSYSKLSRERRKFSESDDSTGTPHQDAKRRKTTDLDSPPTTDSETDSSDEEGTMAESINYNPGQPPPNSPERTKADQMSMPDLATPG